MRESEVSKTVGQLVTERPSRGRVFERYAIDYCCGGKRALTDACAESGARLEEVLTALEEHDRSVGEVQTDWSKAALDVLADHIEEVHHSYLKTEMPRLAALVDKVASVHGERHPELREVRRVYHALKNELDAHLPKEERILFPLIRQIAQNGKVAGFGCHGLLGPIHVMEHEHDTAGECLRQLRTLTGGYVTPADGCNSYRVLMDGLREFEGDLYVHIHKENNILFPMAAQAAGGDQCSH